MLLEITRNIEEPGEGTGGETTQWNSWRKHMMEQVEKPHSGTGGQSM